MQTYFIGCVCLTFVAYTSALYSSSDDVISLDPSNFNKLVLQGDELWIVEFYAPWCGHCQALTPEYKKAATRLKGIAKVGAVDMDQHQSLGGPYNVRGFPTIKIFGANKNKPDDYNGPRTAQGIADAAVQHIKKMVDQRAGGGSNGGGSRGGSGGSGGSGDPKDVIELTDSNFEEQVFGSEDMWLVEFFAPWCGHCKNLAPHWASAATELKGKVKVAAVDATVHTIVANKYGVRGFPTIKVFPAGKKSADSVEDYDGGRTSSDIVNWALEKWSENVPPPEVVQMTEPDSLKNACEDNQLCVISILPNILDCQSECRNSYIKVLQDMGDKYKKKKWGWVWAEAFAQPEVEETFGIGGFGYPAMAVLNARKMKYALLKGPFSESGINEFLRELSFGRGSTLPVKNAALPNVQKTEPWDGKDGELPVEEDIDLSDVELDDLDDANKKTEL